MPEANERKFPHVLDELRDLSREAQSGRLDPVYGREDEVGRLLDGLQAGAIVILRGMSGVGKSAIWDEVARRVSRGQVPADLANLKILVTSVTQLQQGCPYAGYWEQKLGEIVQELEGLRQRGALPLLVISDLGNLFRVSRTSRDDQKTISDDVLSQVESERLWVAGDVTPELFRPGLADDPRWMRRARFVDLPALSGRELGQVLRRVCAHDIAVAHPPFARGECSLLAGVPSAWLQAKPGPEACEATLARAVELSDRFTPSVAQPAGALRLLRLAAEREELSEGGVGRALSRDTGVPLALISDDVPFPHAAIVARLAERVIGQPDAVEAVANTLALVKAGLNDPRRPLGVHLYTGPSGTGKTELARATAELLFGDERALVRFDMSEYFGPSSGERLAMDVVGRTAGRPLSVVLFDEVEKADLGALDILLQICGDGLVSTTTRQASLRQAFVVLTSNVGFSTGREVVHRPTGFPIPGAPQRTGQPDNAVHAALRERFRPELLGRIDQVMVFRRLDDEALRRIVERELRLGLARYGLERRRLRVACDDSLVERLVESGADPRYGARPLQREVRRSVLEPIARWLAAEPDARDRRVQVTTVEGRVTVQQEPLRAPIRLPDERRVATVHDDPHCVSVVIPSR
jgi:ATP-dependent Clp protease ATP-binding subunit ClpA